LGDSETCAGRPRDVLNACIPETPHKAGKEPPVAKGQKKSKREIRKPKAEKPKPAPPSTSFLTPPSKKK